MFIAAVASIAIAKTLTGADNLAHTKFKELEGLRVGLVTNHTAVVDGEHLVDVIHANPKVKLTALFAPEHGLRGLSDAGAKISDTIDEKTGVPVYSLYGSNRRPTKKMLANCDILVFDIQDVGARFYTYISTLGLCMQSAAESNIPFLVLDRPNPLGGDQVSGYTLDSKYASFVGQYPIPIQYGLTIGELAQMIKGEAFLPGLDNLDLRVAKLQNWHRSQLWPQTGLEWISPSPNLPDFATALVYPGTCLFEAVQASEGRGTKTPFLLVGAPYIDSAKTAADLNAQNLPGLKFSAAQFTPKPIKGMVDSPRFKNTLLQGIQIEVTDQSAVKPVEAGIALLDSFYRQSRGLDRMRFFNSGWLQKLSGTDRLEKEITRGTPPGDIVASWQSEVDRFKRQREPYLLYE